ncbi:MAG: O-antigen ligase family protein [Acidobacteria bacterium]|nr:O-antigen ligase family protein [Acidobacteriota bacterium]
MSKKKARPAARPANRRPETGRGAAPSRVGAAAPRDLSGGIAAALLAAAFAGAALAFDSAADASFDAPKRLLVLFAVAGAALAAFGFVPWTLPASRGRLTGWRDRRLPALLAAGAILGAVVSAVASPRPVLAFDSLRSVLLMAALLPLGASRVVARHRGFLLATFIAACGIDAAVSIFQARHLYQPFPLITRGDREATGAFAGNVGYLALGLALAAVAALAVALTRRARGARVAAAGCFLLFSAALLVNRNLTSFSALAAGAAVLLFGLFGRRALLPLAAALLLVFAGMFAYRPMRDRAAEAVRSARAGDWDVVLSYRLAPWAAALRMARERPLTGYGPGTFGAEYVTHRLDAEIASRRRFVSPLATSTYGEAHCDYLQPFAEIGVPAALAAIAAATLLLAGLVRAVRGAPADDRVEALVLLALLSAGAVAALTWFPLQRPITAIPLLLAAGRAWRLTASEAPA